MSEKEFKIAIVRNSTSYLTIENYNPQELGLAKSLALQGIQVDIYYANNTNRDEKIVINDKVNIFYMRHMQLIAQHGIFYNVFKHLKKNKYSIVQVSEESFLQSVLIGVWCRLNGIPVVLWQGMYQEHTKGIHKTIQRIYSFLVLPTLRKCISMVICKTRFAEAYIRKKGFQNTKTIRVGFNKSKLHSFLDHEVSGVLKEIDNSKNIILFVGRLIDDKNPLFVLDLASHYSRNQEVLFIMVGEGKYQDSVKKKIDETHVNLVHIPRLNQQDLGYLYSISKIFLMPSTVEIYGMVYMECMSFGLPVVSLKNAGSNSILNDGEDGYILPELNLSDWVEKIDFLLQNPKAYYVMASNLRKRENQFSWDNLAREYIEVYCSIGR